MSCGCYLGTPDDKQLKSVYSLEDSHILFCQSCRTFWHRTANGVDILAGQQTIYQTIKK